MGYIRRMFATSSDDSRAFVLEFERKIIDNTDVYLDSTQKEGKVLSKLSFVCGISKSYAAGSKGF